MGLKDFLNVIRKHILGQEGQSVNRYENLDLLIERAKKRMKVNVYCPFCNNKLEFRSSKIEGGGIGDAPVNTPIHDDQQWKCVNCFAAFPFGIPITKKEAEEELELRKGVWLLWTLKRKDERARQDVRERLKALGYIDFEM